MNDPPVMTTEQHSIAERLGVHESIRPLWESLDPETQVATALVWICQAGCDGVLRQRYAMKWWVSFLPERVVVSAMTSSTLQEFCATFAQRLQGQVGGGTADEAARHRAMWLEAATYPLEFQRRVLDVLETQPQTCTTLIRAHLDARYQSRRRHDDGPDPQDGRSNHDGASRAPGEPDGLAFDDAEPESPGVAPDPAL